jgi:hypothetical protein
MTKLVKNPSTRRAGGRRKADPATRFRAWADDVRQGDWSVRGLRGRCGALADFLAARGTPLPEIEAVLPGGEQNQDAKGYGAWITAFAKLHAMVRLADVRTDGSGPHAGSRDERVLESARMNLPVVVRLSDGEHQVHAKGYHTLRWLTTLDRQLVALIAEANEYPDDVRVQALAPLLESKIVRTWVWVLTTPGAGLPFREDDAQAEPPAWTLTMSVEDLVVVWQAHEQLHGADCRTIAALFPQDPNAQERMSLGGFIGTMAHEWGVPVSSVGMQWTLRELFAQAVDAARSARAAQERAERERKKSEPSGAARPRIMHAT